MNATMPESSIIPVLSYPDIDLAITWLSAHFEFLERWRVGDHRAQLSFGNGAIAISKGNGAGKEQQSMSLMVRISNVQHHYERSVAAGLTILQKPVEFPYGEKQYTVLDIGGHVWTFSQTMREMAPEDWGAVSARHFQ
ncbi:hypothetical protein [Flavihumibacter petaseus]|uniref:VOC domain-containing protein n=1 Tax=Flavihumibacter petaseus NBRC 106054 TaxID=1220578 RepID=A0A0E9MZE5_9BACT|nr:hypothetical protein [Flavihumibacter petaseus]GAO42989.1 hypothetical protein FPE01S_02_00940 [Flavihumibacter petaseus NBRC 106054]